MSFLEFSIDKNKQTIYETILDNELYIVPLHSIRQNKCTCGDENCSSPGKHPFFKTNWKNIASNKPETVRKWLFDFDKSYNFAVCTGRKNNKTDKRLVVIDVDGKENDFIKKLPSTFGYKTGSGGRHFWYWSSEVVASSISRIAPNVDVRGINGYAIIPPSNHISGKRYEFFEQALSGDNTIKEIPDFLLKLIKSPSISSNKTFSYSHIKKECDNNNSNNIWIQTSIPIIRKWIEKDKRKIPKGMRNIIIHRLLSSDRAKGADENQLQINSIIYKNFCDEPDSIEINEINRIVQSVLKYPPYNVNKNNKKNGISSQLVIENYISWLDKNNIEIEEEIKQKLIEADEFFFKEFCIKTNVISEFLSLKEIINARNNVFVDKFQIKNFHQYSTQALSQKLIDLGFYRYRTNKGNLWNVKTVDMFWRS